MNTTATTPSSPTADLGEIDGWQVGARRVVIDDQSTDIEIVAIIDHEAYDVPVRELWIRRTDEHEPFDVRLGSIDDWQAFQEAVNEVVHALNLDIAVEVGR